jgi:hypothetical protein
MRKPKLRTVSFASLTWRWPPAVLRMAGRAVMVMAEQGGEFCYFVIHAVTWTLADRANLGPVTSTSQPAGRRAGRLDSEDHVGANLLLRQRPVQELEKLDMFAAPLADPPWVRNGSAVELKLASTV